MGPTFSLCRWPAPQVYRMTQTPDGCRRQIGDEDAGLTRRAGWDRLVAHATARQCDRVRVDHTQLVARVEAVSQPEHVVCIPAWDETAHLSAVRRRGAAPVEQEFVGRQRVAGPTGEP